MWLSDGKCIVGELEWGSKNQVEIKQNLCLGCTVTCYVAGALLVKHIPLAGVTWCLVSDARHITILFLVPCLLSGSGSVLEDRSVLEVVFHFMNVFHLLVNYVNYLNTHLRFYFNDDGLRCWSISVEDGLKDDGFPYGKAWSTP